MKSIYEDAYRELIAKLADARRLAGISQQRLADQLGRPQSFVSKTEIGERRLDVIEYLEICQYLGVDAPKLLADIRLGRRGRR